MKFPDFTEPCSFQQTALTDEWKSDVSEECKVFHVYLPINSLLCLSPFSAFRDVHAVCLWDDKGPAKIHQALKEDILDFIKQAQAVSI